MTKIQLIIIGNELLNGKISDKNIHWLASFCYENNLEFQKAHIIADNEEQFKKTLDFALKDADVVLTSGGLGPTRDDLTKRMLGEYFNKEITHNENAWKITTSHYDRYGRDFIKEHIDYGNIPKDFIPVYNPVGFAPGLFYGENKKCVAALPGVPSEFQSMFTEEIYPLILKHTEQIKIFNKHIIVKTTKVHESKIFTEISPTLWSDLEKFGEVSSLPHAAGVDVSVRLVEFDQKVIDKKEKEILDLIQASNLSSYIWHIGPQSIEEVIIQKAKEKNITIGFAESCTGGLLAHRITNVSGSSSVFWGSVVSYANEVKTNVLNVSEDTLKEFGAVSEQTAKEMAQGALKTLGVDLVVSTTGIAGPGGGSVEKPVGTVGIGFATKNDAGSKIYRFNGNRESLKHSFSQKALFSMLDILNKL